MESLVNLSCGSKAESLFPLYVCPLYSSDWVLGKSLICTQYRQHLDTKSIYSLMLSGDGRLSEEK